jgi:hypothetical protein
MFQAQFGAGDASLLQTADLVGSDEPMTGSSPGAFPSLAGGKRG